MTGTIHRDPDAADKVHLVASFYENLSKGDVPGTLSLLDPAVQWTEAEGFPYYSGTWIGPDAVLEKLLKRLATEWTGFAATPDDYMVEGSRVIAFGTYTGVYKQTGKAMRSNFAHVWTIANGKLASFLMYADTAKVREALTA